jgi:hypothetical protein
MAAAMTAGAMTQQITIVMVCGGVIPTALNTPRSCTRSPVAISAALSTPSPASPIVTAAAPPVIAGLCELPAGTPVPFVTAGLPA